MILFPIRIFKANDRSMEPAISSGVYLIVNTWYRKLKIGDIIVLRHPQKNINIVKRVSSTSDNLIFVIGDNKNESEDSRSFGGVERNKVIGKLLLKA